MKLETRTGNCFSETKTVYGWSEQTGIHAMAAVVNSLLADGSTDLGVGVRFQYPSGADKTVIYKMEKNIEKTCKDRQIQFLESGIFENPMLTVPAVTVNGLGREVLENESDKGTVFHDEEKKLSGKSIVQTKWIGMDGMLQIAIEQGEELKKRFAPAFIRRILSHRQALFADKEIEVAKARGVSAMRQITEGGIFAALWELAKESGQGMVVDMKQILVLQETIEVCEHFRMNPYQMTSTGSFLMISDDGEALADALKQEGIDAAVIGQMTDDNDKIIKNGEDVRYIDRPAPDEILKLYIEK